ncbi:hypothetical protein ACH5RR_003678 [Cinchona calisaya]|uniref:RNase H type-1 domain-containing protein n=1 Tax=Cinchona calisaya TaxID=153742 RepID=A0ABD3AVH0_9GENT
MISGLGQGWAVSKSPKPLTPILVSWTAPPFGSCKLNVDGSFISSSGLTGGRGLLRNSEGSLLDGFALSFGYLALIHSIQLGIECGYMDIMIESDSQALCRRISKDSPHS